MKHSFNGGHIKLISALLTAFLMCGTTGCVSNGNLSSVVDHFDPVPVPEGGWTAKSLSKTIRINGMELPEPVTVENFGKDYSVDETHTLMYNGSQIAVIIFDEESVNVDDCEKTIGAFALNTNAEMDIKAFYVNGITLGSSAVDAIKAFGEPSEKPSEDIWVYYESGKSADDNIMVLWLDEEDCISWISIRL